MKQNLATNVGPISLQSPTMLASGILGISLDVFKRIHQAGAGAVVTKSLSKEPWEGYPNPTIFEVSDRGWLNAVGLSNPGAPNFAKMISTNSDIPIIVSLVGSSDDEFEFMIKQFENCKIIGYELNLSCPHVAKVGLEVGDDTELVQKIIKKIKSITKIPIIAKVGLGTTHYLETVDAACQAGVDAITAINTLRAMAIDIETQRPILSNKIGGLSGSPIKPIAVRCVYEISSKFDIPIIGCGGVSSWEDAVEFILAGASAVQLGSVVGDSNISIFSEINDGISKYMEQKNFSSIRDFVGLAKKFNKPTIRKIEKIVDETPTVRTMTFSDDVLSDVKPGQFAMVWIPGVNELPMSVMISPEQGKAAFTVRTHGPASTALYNLKVGDVIGIRGPYGNHFDIKQGKLLLAGGGTGLVPLIRLLTFVKNSDDVTLLIGAKTKEEVFFEKLANQLLENNNHKVIVSTEDGSYGEEGFVTDVSEKLLRNSKFDAVYTCGPELMMHKIVKLATTKGIFVQASIERMMKCGVGICGSCCMGEDLVCRDGTIFEGKYLLSNPEFGRTYRNKAGITEKY